MLIRRTYKYRLRVSKTTAARLDWVLWQCRQLYNAALQERIGAYQMRRVSVNYYDQANQLPSIKEVCPEYKEVGSHVLQDVLRRLDKAFQNFFRRVKQGQTPGFPRYQGRNRYDSFTFPDIAGWKLDGDRLTLSKIGDCRIILHRPLEGSIKTVTIKREGQHWYVCFSCEVEVAVPTVAVQSEVGLDVGLLHWATLSSGEQIANPRYLRKSLAKLKVEQQSLALKRRGSNRRKQQVRRVAELHRRVANQRKDFAHKISRRLVDSYDAVYTEDLRLTNMVKLHNMALSFHDAGFGMFNAFGAYKAASAGKLWLQVNPRYTSQTCSGCGVIQKKELSERWHSCLCGTELDRDHNAAINILRLGTSLRVGQPTAMLTPLGVGGSRCDGVSVTSTWSQRWYPCLQREPASRRHPQSKLAKLRHL